MQRERKREQQRERFYARELRKRAKRNKNSQPEGRFQPPSGANAAADTLESEGMKTSPAAVENSEVAADSSRGRSREVALESPCACGSSRRGFPVLI